jgi:hypothetical protein
MGLIPLADAKEKIESGRFGVSTNQAIFYIKNSKYIQYV